MEKVLLSSSLVKSEGRAKRVVFLKRSFENTRKILESDASVLKKRVRKNERYIDLMFYTPPETDAIINRLVAYATKESEYQASGEETYSEFAHVEISFHVNVRNEIFDENKFMAFSITQNSNVFFRLKYWRKEYTALRIVVSDEVYCKLYNTCASLALQKIKFDQFAMYSGTVAPESMVKNRSRQEHGTFCSKVIAEVLQEHNIGPSRMKDLLPYRSTPSLLYKCLKT